MNFQFFKCCIFSVEPKYSDPLSGASPSFQQRLMELAALEAETVRWERTKKVKKKQPKQDRDSWWYTLCSYRPKLLTNLIVKCVLCCFNARRFHKLCWKFEWQKQTFRKRPRTFYYWRLTEGYRRYVLILLAWVMSNDL